jgi:hypothetical protein
MSSQQTESPASSVGEILRNRGFLVCLVLLLSLAGGFRAIAYKTGRRPGPKEPAPIRKPLRLLDQAKLAPYEVLQAADIKAEVLDQLGTKEYLQWTLRDTTADRNSPVSIVNLFVTYYTDNPGQVVHVPEECLFGSGYTPVGEELNQILIPALQQTVAFKVLKFEKTTYAGRESRVVMYTFHVNGVFAPEGRAVSTIMNDPRSRHGYFSKIELSFGGADTPVPFEASVEAGKRLLQKVLPILVRDHWPDWEQLERKNVPAGDQHPPQAASLR